MITGLDQTKLSWSPSDWVHTHCYGYNAKGKGGSWVRNTLSWLPSYVGISPPATVIGHVIIIIIIIIIIICHVLGIIPMSGMWFRVCGRIRTRVSTGISLPCAHCCVFLACGVRCWFGAKSVVKMGCSRLDFCLASGIHAGRWTWNRSSCLFPFLCFVSCEIGTIQAAFMS